ncbi:MAG: hypothetical protein ACD_20C00143G0001 [uncultured bacterium]|nr:MAG: hypothetical protein ACD_20C00143G0001 [uncultured bacterium]
MLSIVCSPDKVVFVEFTTNAGVFGTRPPVATESTYDFVVTSVGFIIAPVFNVIMFAIKFPELSLFTIVSATLLLVAESTRSVVWEI